MVDGIFLFETPDQILDKINLSPMENIITKNINE